MELESFWKKKDLNTTCLVGFDGNWVTILKLKERGKKWCFSVICGCWRNTGDTVGN